jgi:choline-sulfatase
MARRVLTLKLFAKGHEAVSCLLSRSSSPALRAPSPPMGARGLTIMFTFPAPQRGEGSCERIQFLLPSLARRRSGAGRKSRYTNPLKSPLTKGDTRKVIPKPIFSQLQGPGVRGVGKRFRNCRGNFGTGLLHFAWRSATQIAVLLVICSGVLTASKKAPCPVILISVDTLRADHLSCYGYRGLQTPSVDSLARGGSLFYQVSSQVPLTLPSHASMLTSTLPFSNGVEDHGSPLAPNPVTLASVLKSKGYQTSAFVGGFVLDRRFGLNQGFDFYDSPFNLRRQRGADPGEIRRSGDEVVTSAISWMRANSNAPFFVFLHLYDLHLPYQIPPSAPPRLHGYEAALAYEDEVLGRFLSFLRQSGWLAKSLIVFTSDHGESLWDHGESSHGYFVYQSTLRVPLIIHWPDGTKGFPARMEEPASLLDVAPTVLQFLDIPRPEQFQGRGLLDLVNSKTPGSPPREIYSESLYAQNHFGCSSLRSLRLGRYKYIEAPKPEFYDLASDPVERHNLYSQQKSLAMTYRERLQALRARFLPAPAERSQAVSPEVPARARGTRGPTRKTESPTSKAIGAQSICLRLAIWQKPPHCLKGFTQNIPTSLTFASAWR